MHNPEKRGVITGSGLESDKEKLPAVSVANEVVWVNPDVRMPFRFEEGKPTPLAMFLTPKPKEGEQVFELGVLKEHWRSGLLGKVIFEDKEGRLYRDVDIKGGGAVEEGPDGSLRVDPNENDKGKRVARRKTPWGFFDKGFAETDVDWSEDLAARGLRIHRALAIIKLKEVVDEHGNKISITEAKKRGYIKTTTEPVIEVRAFGTRARIANAKDRELVEDAVKMVSQELRREGDFGMEDYVEWFGETLGRQMAIIHSAGSYHNYLTPHNVTLDCRVVDFDSIHEISKGKAGLKEIEGDINEVSDTLNRLVTRLENFMGADDNRRKAVKKLFWKGYAANLNTKNKTAILEALREKYGSN